MEQALHEKDKKLLDSYHVAAINKMDYLDFYVNIKLLNFGIKVGME